MSRQIVGEGRKVSEGGGLVMDEGGAHRRADLHGTQVCAEAVEAFEVVG